MEVAFQAKGGNWKEQAIDNAWQSFEKTMHGVTLLSVVVWLI
jgi:hypothetical protein